MGNKSIPIVVLAGSDRKPVDLPERGRDKHVLGGYKSVDVSIDGQPLICRVVERLQASGQFGPIYVAGPIEVYRGKVGTAEIVDTNGSFGDNVQSAIERVAEIHPAIPIGFTVCDILPDPELLARVMADYHRSTPCDLWCPVVRAQQRERLGASDWKPAYRIIGQEGEPPTRVLPGHLLVADLSALRLKFLYRLMDLGYRTRNRSIDHRRGEIVRGVLGDMLYQDFLNILRLRAPNLTWSVLRASIPASVLLRRGAITRRRLEETTRRILVKRRHRRSYPERRVMLPIVDALFLARDIDTVEEAGEIGGSLVG